MMQMQILAAKKRLREEVNAVAANERLREEDIMEIEKRFREEEEEEEEEITQLFV
jgi:hypothetical protein